MPSPLPASPRSNVTNLAKIAGRPTAHAGAPRAPPISAMRAAPICRRFCRRPVTQTNLPLRGCPLVLDRACGWPPFPCLLPVLLCAIPDRQELKELVEAATSLTTGLTLVAGPADSRPCGEAQILSITRHALNDVRSIHAARFLHAISNWRVQQFTSWNLATRSGLPALKREQILQNGQSGPKQHLTKSSEKPSGWGTRIRT